MIVLGHLVQSLFSLKVIASLRIASVCNESRKNLQTIIGCYKIMHRVGTVDALTQISEILSGMILRISTPEVSEIESRSVSISNLFSKYLFMLGAFGLMGTIT